MKIGSIGSISQKIKSPFKSGRTSSNPFDQHSQTGSAFKGSVLPFADVFQVKNDVKAINRVKLMSASVIASVSNFGRKVSEPIALFAHRVRTGIANTIQNIKETPQRIGQITKNVSQNVKEKLNVNVFRKNNSENEEKVLSMRHINTKASVSDLKATWIEENRLEKVKEAV